MRGPEVPVEVAEGTEVMALSAAIVVEGAAIVRALPVKAHPVAVASLVAIGRRLDGHLRRPVFRGRAVAEVAILIAAIGRGLDGHLRRPVFHLPAIALAAIEVAILLAAIGRRLNGHLGRGRAIFTLNPLRLHGGLRRGTAAAILMPHLAGRATRLAGRRPAMLLLLAMAAIAMAFGRISPGRRHGQERQGSGGDQVFAHEGTSRKLYEL
jgi:hypothetical protein